jgi:hypothetical protein
MKQTKLVEVTVGICISREKRLEVSEARLSEQMPPPVADAMEPEASTCTQCRRRRRLLFVKVNSWVFWRIKRRGFVSETVGKHIF